MNEEQIFAEAIQLPVEQREAFLQTVMRWRCGLRKRVEQLLAAHESPDSLLEVAATHGQYDRCGGGRQDIR